MGWSRAEYLLTSEIGLQEWGGGEPLNRRPSKTRYVSLPKGTRLPEPMESLNHGVINSLKHVLVAVTRKPKSYCRVIIGTLILSHSTDGILQRLGFYQSGAELMSLEVYLKEFVIALLIIGSRFLLSRKKYHLVQVLMMLGTLVFYFFFL